MKKTSLIALSLFALVACKRHTEASQPEAASTTKPSATASVEAPMVKIAEQSRKTLEEAKQVEQELKNSAEARQKALEAQEKALEDAK